MKKYYNFLLCIALIVVTTGCKNKENPGPVGESFLKHIVAFEFSEAKLYCTLETQQVMDKIEPADTYKKLLSSLTAGKDNGEISIETVQCVTDGNNAQCRYKVAGKQISISLLKSNDTWKVHITELTRMQELFNSIFEIEKKVTDVIDDIMNNKYIDKIKDIFKD